MSALEICLLICLFCALGGWVSSFISYLRLERLCKRLLKMNSDLFLEMIKLSEVEYHDQNPFEEFKGENH